MFETDGNPVFDLSMYGLDIHQTYLGAQWLVSNHGGPPIELMLLSSPLYVFILAAKMQIVGDQIFALKLFQILIVCTKYSVLFYMLRRLGAKLWSAFLVGAVFTMTPAFVYFDTALIKSSYETLFLIGALYLLVRLDVKRVADPERAWRFGIGLGAVLGLLSLTQIGALLWLVPVGYFLISNNNTGKRNRRVVITTIASSILVFASARVMFSSSIDWPVFLSRWGYDLKLAFWEGAGIFYKSLPDVSNNLFGHAFESKLALELKLNQSLSQSDANWIYATEAIRFVLDNPMTAIGTILKKAFFLFNNVEFRGIDDLVYLQDQSLVLRLLPFGFVFILLMAATGLVQMSFGTDRRLFCFTALSIIAILGFVIATNLNWRYRLPLYIALSYPMGVGLECLQTAIRNLRKDPNLLINRRAIVFASVTCAALTIGFWPMSSEIETEFAEKRKRTSEFYANLPKDLQLVSPDRRFESAESELIVRSAAFARLANYTASFRMLHEEFSRRPVSSGMKGVFRNYVFQCIWLENFGGKEWLQKASALNPRLMEELIRDESRKIYKNAMQRILGE